MRADTKASTVNGSVRVTTTGLAEASTVNGEMESDFPMTVSGRFGPRRWRGTIGTGGRTLNLSTVNGEIRLKKSS
ncbi:MAG: hypothetical protein WD773_07330 [Gemmatimonadales bacterium]